MGSLQRRIEDLECIAWRDDHEDSRAAISERTQKWFDYLTKAKQVLYSPEGFDLDTLRGESLMYIGAHLTWAEADDHPRSEELRELLEDALVARGVSGSESAGELWGLIDVYVTALRRQRAQK